MNELLNATWREQVPPLVATEADEHVALAVVNSQRETAITPEIVGQLSAITSPVLIDLDPDNLAMLKLDLKPDSELMAMATNGDEVLTDIETWTRRAAELFVGQAQARARFFNDLFVHGEWRQLKLQKPELTGAVSEADKGSRQYAQFVRLVFAKAADLGADDNDLPNRSEVFEWYWLAHYRWVLQLSAVIPENFLPCKRSQVRPLRQMFRDCHSNSEVRIRMEQMVEDIAAHTSPHKPLAKNELLNPLTAHKISKWGTPLAAKSSPIPTARKAWRELAVLPPRQAKAAKVLDDLNVYASRQSLSPDLTKVIRAVIATFTDDRHVLVVVDGEGLVTGLFVQLRHIFGAAVPKMRQSVKGRKAGASARWVFGLLPKWDVMTATLELAKAASDYRDWAARTRRDLGTWPPDRADEVTRQYPLVFADASQAERYARRTNSVSLRAVPLVSVVKFLQDDLHIEGRYWEDVADEVTEPLFHDNDEPEESAAD